MRTQIQAFVLLLVCTGCSAPSTGADLRSPRTLEYVQSEVGSCLIGGDDFHGDAQWNTSQCGPIAAFNGQDFETSVVDSETEYEPTPDLLVPQKVYFLRGQYMRNGTLRYVSASSIKLAPDVDAVMFIGFVGWCESTMSSADCANDAWTHGRYHDEPRLCIQNPAFVGVACAMNSEGIAEVEYTIPTANGLSISTEPLPCPTGAEFCAFKTVASMALSSSTGVGPLTFEWSHISGASTMSTTTTTTLTHVNGIPLCSGGCPFIYRVRSRDYFGLYSPYVTHE